MRGTGDTRGIGPLFSCLHCRVRLYIAVEEVPRYYFPPSEKVGEEVFFIPYWHVRGAQFSVRPADYSCRVLDTTFLAGGSTQLPPTLGVRAQALKMRYAVDSVAGRFLDPDLSYEEMIPLMLKRSRIGEKAVGGEVVYRTFLCSRASLVYSPVTLRGGEIYDAVLDRFQSRLREDGPPRWGPDADRRSWQVKFLAALCPNCGWDLPEEKKGIVLLCAHCHRAWRLHRTGFHELGFEFASGAGAVYLPFWRMAVRIEGLPLSSFADLVRLANLPRAVREEWERDGISFWAPAFQLRPRLFLRLARQFTVHPPMEEGEGEVPRGEIFPVTLGVREAFDSIRVTLATLVAEKRRIFPLLPSVKVEFLSAGLVYFPFAVQGGDFILERMQVSIRRNALRP